MERAARIFAEDLAVSEENHTVRLVPIDFMDIYRQTGMKRGKIGFSPAFGWCAYRHSPEDGIADCAMFTPPPMEPGETELRIVNGTHWEFSKPNPKVHILQSNNVQPVVGIPE